MAPRRIRTWDLPTRMLHLALLGSVAVAWWSGDQVRRLDLHVAAGTVVALVLGLRLLWGLVGTEHVRWRGLLQPWSAVRRQLQGLVDGSAPRWLGHNPVAAWALVAGLGLLAALSLTGALVLGGEEQEGLLAGVVGVSRGIALHRVHEVLAWALLGWIGLHLGGVAKESLRTRENLVLSMVHGWKRPEPGARSVPPRPGAALAVGLVLVLACAGPCQREWGEEAGSGTLSALPRSPLYEGECGDCHEAWHPSLLPARSWVVLMAGQDDHFGEYLGLAPDVAGAVQDFLVRHAAELSESEAAVRVARTTPASQTPLRITETPMWVQAHADLSPETFQAEPVGSESRCLACHEDALGGRFANRAIHLPDTPETL